MYSTIGVSQDAVDLLTEEVRLAGLPIKEVQRALPPHPCGFYAWNDFLDACDIISDLAGGLEAFASAVQATILDAIPYLTNLSHLFASASAFARFAGQAVDASAFVGLRYDVSVLDSRRLVVRLRTAQGWALRPALVAGVAGAFRAITVPFGHGATRVETLGAADSGVLQLHLPAAAEGANAPSTGAERGLSALLRQQRQGLEHRHRLAMLFAQDPARVVEQPVSRPASERALRARKRWGLTERETDVLACICSGLTNKEIAAALSRAESTIELHVTRILRKLSAPNRAALVAHYYRL